MKLGEIQTAILAGAVVGVAAFVAAGLWPSAATPILAFAGTVVTGVFALARGGPSS